MSTFESLGLDEDIVSAITKLGFETPTPIQTQAIPQILEHQQDLIALAQTGTGKTAAFGLPIVQMVDEKTQVPQAIVLSPTRELAIQITKDLKSFAKNKGRLPIMAVYGGTPIYNQIKSLRQGVAIVAGTPGRILDLINRGVLDLSQIKYVVLDEADEMLNMGFQQDLDSILEAAPAERQTLLFSATMAPQVSRIANRYMKNPAEITVGSKNAGATKVEHHFYQVSARDRYEALRRILTSIDEFYGIVFCRTRRDTNNVARKLNGDGFQAVAISGDLSQAQRDNVMYRFRERQESILVATDVAARGLDVNDLTHVINYELPDDPEVYIHRSGRTGRAGKEGISIAIIHSRESRKIHTLERMSGKTFIKGTVPTGDSIIGMKLQSTVRSIREMDYHPAQLEQYLNEIQAGLADLDREELIKRFLYRELKGLLYTYQGAPDLNVSSPRRDDRRDRDRGGDRRDRDRGGREGGRTESRRGSSKVSRFSINVGAKQELNVNRLLSLINQNVRDRQMRIGKITILKKLSYFEVDDRYSDMINNSFKNAHYDGTPIEVSQVAPDQPIFDRKGGDSEDAKTRKNRKRRQKKKR
ncbi:MAG: DEAD/DEAH box helicase [Bacteroidia bacterium]